MQAEEGKYDDKKKGGKEKRAKKKDKEKPPVDGTDDGNNHVNHENLSLKPRQKPRITLQPNDNKNGA